jgi:hypothetical protein
VEETAAGVEPERTTSGASPRADESFLWYFTNKPSDSGVSTVCTWDCRRNYVVLAWAKNILGPPRSVAFFGGPTPLLRNTGVGSH